jgi:hypothetical protein
MLPLGQRVHVVCCVWVTAVTGNRQVLQIRWQDRFFGLRAFQSFLENLDLER